MCILVSDSPASDAFVHSTSQEPFPVQFLFQISITRNTAPQNLVASNNHLFVHIIQHGQGWVETTHLCSSGLKLSLFFCSSWTGGVIHVAASGWLGWSPGMAGLLSLSIRNTLCKGLSTWSLLQRSWTSYLESQGSYGNILTMRPQKKGYLPLSHGAS